MNFHQIINEKVYPAKLTRLLFAKNLVEPEPKAKTAAIKKPRLLSANGKLLLFKSPKDKDLCYSVKNEDTGKMKTLWWKSGLSAKLNRNGTSSNGRWVSFGNIKDYCNACRKYLKGKDINLSDLEVKIVQDKEDAKDINDKNALPE